MKLPAEEFAELAEAAWREIPERFRSRVANLELAVLARPGREAGRWRGSRSLLGLYAGPTRAELADPLAEPLLPARIILYRANLLALCGDRGRLRAEIRATLRHELGHHFGFSDAEMPE